MDFIIFNDTSVFHRRSSGPYRLATLLRQRGYSVQVIEYLHVWNNNELLQLLDKLVNNNTLAFGFSYTWMQNDAVQRAIKLLKTHYPDKKIFAGGQQPFQHDLGFDLMVTGYIENSLDQILEYIINDTVPEHAKYIANINGLHIDANKSYPAPNIPDLTVEYVDSDFVDANEVVTLELSRGCRFACKFCCYPFLGFKHSTFRNPENLRQELINNYEKYGITSYTIADDTVNDDDAKLEMLAEVVESLPFDVDFAAFVRVDLVATRPHHLELLKRCRIWAHFYGIETFHPEAAKTIGKGMRADRIQDTLLQIREYFLNNLGLYRGSCGLIAGLPHEPPESWQQTQQWMTENWSDQSWHWWPLDITDDQDNDIIQSDIARNKEKYGYSKITDQQLIDDFLFSERKYLTHHLVDDKFFFWQNEHTHFFEAFKFAHKIAAIASDQRVPNFYILSYKNEVENKQELLNLSRYYEAKWLSQKPMHKYKKKIIDFFVKTG